MDINQQVLVDLRMALGDASAREDYSECIRLVNTILSLPWLGEETRIVYNRKLLILRELSK